MKHGHWEQNLESYNGWYFAACSECHCGDYYKIGSLTKYCPNCGALMSDAVKHAHWIFNEDETGEYSNTYKCSECGAVQQLDYGDPEYNEWFYCPRCGARLIDDTDNP